MPKIVFGIFWDMDRSWEKILTNRRDASIPGVVIFMTLQFALRESLFFVLLRLGRVLRAT